MADLLGQMAEAHILDWQRRVAAGEVDPHQPLPLAVDSWESQLFKEIVRLRGEARAVEDSAEQERLRTRAEGLRLQLMMVVERDRPQLARALAARLLNA
jgi:hypothetical protein